MRRSLVILCLLALVTACSDDGDGGTASTTATEPGGATTTVAPPARSPILFSPEGNNLWAYATVAGESDPPAFASQLVNRSNHDDPDGWDINGQVCTLPTAPGDPPRIVAGEDTGQPDPPAGWGVFEVTGDAVGDLAVRRVARLVPEFAADDEEPDTYGCGVLSDGRVVTTTIGNNAAGPANGHLVLWFPPFDDPDGAGIAQCAVATDLATAQQVWVDADDRVYVASARPPTSGVWRFADLPASPDDCAPVAGEQVVVAGDGNPLVSPNGIVGAPDGTLFVSSIINGVIAELGPEGSFRRTVLAPPDGEVLGAEPYSTGTPLGLALGADGTLYYADLGLVRPDGGVPGPGAGTGSVRRITFVDGEPQAPDTVADGLTFPDGLGLWLPEVTGQ